jgi:iron complex transport system permease protein
MLLLMAVCIGGTVPFEASWQVLFELLGGRTEALSDVQRYIVLHVRLPRALLGLFIGSSLAVAGATLQSLFRNPLAEPTLIGITGGATVGAALYIVLAGVLLPAAAAAYTPWLMPLSAFGFGLLATIFVFRLSRRGGITSIATLLLAGIAINAFAGAIIGLLINFASATEIESITFWTLGSLGGATWQQVGIVGLCSVPLLGLMLRSARQMNVLLLGEAEAGHLGVNTERLKQGAILLIALAIGAGVAYVGTIGFVGLVVPHMLRLLFGPDMRIILPGSLLGGAALLLGADIIARTAVAPQELSIGVITSALGAPFFLWLLQRNRKWQTF